MLKLVAAYFEVEALFSRRPFTVSWCPQQLLYFDELGIPVYNICMWCIWYWIVTLMRALISYSGFAVHVKCEISLQPVSSLSTSLTTYHIDVVRVLVRSGCHQLAVYCVVASTKTCPTMRKRDSSVTTCVCLSTQWSSLCKTAMLAYSRVCCFAFHMRWFLSRFSHFKSTPKFCMYLW